MPFRQISVTDQVTQLAAYNPKRIALSVANDAGSTVYLSNNRVNVTSEGFPLAVGEKRDFTVALNDNPAEELNGQCLPGLSADVRIYEAFREEAQ